MYGAKWCHKAADWIRLLPIYFNIELNGKSILMVHAGITTKDIRMSDDFISDGYNEMIDIPKIGEVWSQHLLWIRERWFYDKDDYPYDYIIFGHSPTTHEWWETLNWFDEKQIKITGSASHIIHMSGYDNGHIRYCIDTGRNCMGLMRLDDMTEFYSDVEERT